MNVDVFNLIRTNHTLPDETFLKKRFVNVLKSIHPDKKGQSTTTQTARVNVARDRLLNEFYQDDYKQITLFHAVLNTVLQGATQTPQSLMQPATQHGSSPFIVLFLVGSFVGFAVVFSLNKKKTKVK